MDMKPRYGHTVSLPVVTTSDYRWLDYRLTRHLNARRHSTVDVIMLPASMTSTVLVDVPKGSAQ